MARDEVRRHYRGDDYALTSELGGAGDHVVLLVTDSRDTTDGPAAYPTGASWMYSIDWDTPGNFAYEKAPGVVHTMVYEDTEAAEPSAVQWLYSDAEGYGRPFYRYWTPDDDEWSGWEEFVSFSTYFGHTHNRIVPLAEDAFAEADPITDFPLGISMMPVTGGANWGPNAGEAGRVLNHYDGTNGHQVFSANNGNTYRRVYTSGAWGSWAALILEGDSRLTNARAPTAHATTHTNGTDDIQNATGSQKGLATAAQITKLDGIETAATADQTAAEILTALLTVDGTGSLLDADKLDGNDSAAFVQTTRTISTTAPLTGGGDLSANRTLAVSTATETAEGVSERATQAETNTGTDDVRYVSPAKLANYTGITNKALASDLSDHLADTTDAHDASAISVLDSAAQYAAVNVEDALAEVLDALQAHEADAVDAHDATAISYSGSTNLVATDVDGALDELDTEKTPATRTISTTAPLTGGGDLSANRTLAVSDASDTASGVVELATDAETNTGTDTARAITPANLSARTATETRTGVVELATDAEVQTGTDTTRAITAANLTARTPTETRAGVIELATQAETNTGTDDVRAVTPLKLKTNVDLHINDTSAAHTASAISYAGGTGMSATNVEDAIDELATEKVNTGTTPQYSTHFYGSTLSVQTGVGRDYIFDAGTITAVAATVNTASSSGSISLSFKKNGVQFTTLSITASSNSATTAGLSTAVAAGDYITVDITGAGTGSADLVAKVRYVV